ncbi:GFA family protein [Pelagibius marinus]|uniref:GFA family protein n=1 Tax=Pelagibius marinus TaxID=2762760 RepID=UPI0018728FB9|nr:GFA family protein [Pelagibius marinus]
MSKTPEPTTGGCMCGAVRYEAQGRPLGVAYCHCRSCRKQTGAPVVTFVAFEADKVRFLNRERKIHHSSPGVKRAFCDHCGTPLSWEGPARTFGATIIEFYISTLDDPDGFVPDRHWFHGERLPWFDVADDLPRFHGLEVGEKPVQHGPGPSRAAVGPEP